VFNYIPKRIWKTAVLCSVLQPPSIRELATPSSIAGWHYRRTSQLALCRTRYYHLRVSDNFALSTLVQSMTVKAARTNRSCGVYFMQFAAVCRTLYTAQTSVCTECHCTTDHWHAAQRSYLAGIIYANFIDYPSESASSSECHAWFASRLSTWPTTAVSCPTALGALSVYL